MPVKKDPNGRRYVEAEAEVPGTPEQVWQAIASGPGVSSWFVPTKIDGRVGGTVTASFGPGMDSEATITAWDPPRKFVAEGADMGPNSPNIATEWVVEARQGGTCLVRVVHSWFADTDDWDNQFEGTEHGWVAFFRILRLYLAHFPGQPSAGIQLLGFSARTTPETWDAFTTMLGVAAAREGGRVATVNGAPTLAGQVERTGSVDYPELLVRLDAPAPGVAHFFAMKMGPSVCVSARLYLYGKTAPAAVSEQEPKWTAWFAERFPPPGATSPSAAS